MKANGKQENEKQIVVWWWWEDLWRIDGFSYSILVTHSVRNLNARDSEWK